MLRTGNRKLAAATLLLDAVKGAAAVLIARGLAGPEAALWAGFGALLGHCFPVWLGFRGGKGVATAYGVLLAAAWPVGLLAGAVWLAMAKLSRLSSASALTAFALAPVLALLLADHAVALLALGIAVVVFVAPPRQHPPPARRHRAAHRQRRMTARATPDDAEDRFRLARTDGVGPITYRRLMRRYGSAAAALDALPGLARAGGRDAPPRVAQARRRRARDRPAGPPRRPHRCSSIRGLSAAARPAGRCAAGDRRAGRRCAARPPRRRRGRRPQRLGQRPAHRRNPGRAISQPPGWSSSPASRAASTPPPIRARCRTGRTIAVIAGGLDCPYPPENADLQRRIAEARCGPGRGAARHRAAGRAISPAATASSPGLALGVVVVEAAPRSGSLITARLAQEAGREVFAVPGSPLDPRARGANDLLRQGAHLTETAADVLDNLPDHPSREGIGRSPLFARGAAAWAFCARFILEPPDPTASGRAGQPTP